ncbi:MAG: diguanylate phosphodiesterase, partial [Pseudonocardia sp.]|nr:diguanylate phosphodiesterase [Pseudonocardia sp.]
MPLPEDADQRLERLVDLVVRLASGDLGARLEPSPAADRIDAVVVGLGMLAEELQWLNGDLERRVAERTRQLEEAHRQLERLALYDPLTGLANRTLLGDRLARAVAGA